MHGQNTGQRAHAYTADTRLSSSSPPRALLESLGTRPICNHVLGKLTVSKKNKLSRTPRSLEVHTMLMEMKNKVDVTSNLARHLPSTSEVTKQFFFLFGHIYIFFPIWYASCHHNTYEK